MTEKIEQLPHAEGFIVSEANGYRSREEITVYENKLVLAGTVLGYPTSAPYEYVEYQGEATDGSEVARAIATRDVDCTAGPAKVAAIVRDAEVRRSDLIWRDGMTDQYKLDGATDLAQAGIIVRDVSPAASTEKQIY